MNIIITLFKGLREDQIATMHRLGIPCAVLRRTHAEDNTDVMQQELLQDIVDGRNPARAIFLTPEKLSYDSKNSRRICDALKKLSQSKRIGMIVSDQKQRRFPSDQFEIDCLEGSYPLVVGR